MPGNSSVLEFISQRQQEKEKFNRAAIAHQYKVAVPPTRFPRQSYEISDKLQGQNLVSNPSFPKATTRSVSVTNRNTRKRGNAFDTDAESIYDTTAVATELTTTPYNGKTIVEDVVGGEHYHLAWRTPPNDHVGQLALDDEGKESSEEIDEDENYDGGSENVAMPPSTTEGSLQSPGLAKFRQPLNLVQADLQPPVASGASNCVFESPEKAKELSHHAKSYLGGRRACEIKSSEDVSNQKLPSKIKEHCSKHGPRKYFAVAQGAPHSSSPGVHVERSQLQPGNEPLWQPIHRKHEKCELDLTSHLDRRRPDGQARQAESSFPGTEQCDGDKTPSAVHTPNQKLQIGDRERDLDYSLDDLAQMSYQQLREESFDHNPAKICPQLGTSLTDGPVPERLYHLMSVDKIHEKGQLRMAFFSSLTIKQYEECGDLVIDTLGEIISKFKEARQRRRKVARKFEEEIATREAHVRNKVILVEDCLERMKDNGIDLVNRGRDPTQGPKQAASEGASHPNKTSSHLASSTQSGRDGLVVICSHGAPS